jgi:hypothetical protein
MFCPKLLLELLLNLRGSDPSTILAQLKYLTVSVTHPHLKLRPREKNAVACDLAFWRMCMFIPAHLFLQFPHRLSFSTPSRSPAGKLRARAPARFVLSFFLCSLSCNLCFISVALSSGEPSDGLAEAITPLTLKKKGALAPRETYGDAARDKAPTPPPSAGSPDVYLEDM